MGGRAASGGGGQLKTGRQCLTVAGSLKAFYTNHQSGSLFYPNHTREEKQGNGKSKKKHREFQVLSRMLSEVLFYRVDFYIGHCGYTYITQVKTSMERFTFG
ncbi:hypothetical protein E5288_WYG012110 [Bos mutus]|uniref:Uncharacterized protein n=1 Tax=Bos mutus TaxID=72004 RepID=A0A6B0R574_9CETA|nr:hypothetical protein [Bos mutus]